MIPVSGPHGGPYRFQAVPFGESIEVALLKSSGTPSVSTQPRMQSSALVRAAQLPAS